MPKTFSPAPDDVREIVDQMLAKYHPEVLKAGVKIDLLSVAHDDEDKPALTLHGYPCNAVIRVVGIKERTKGAGDVEITIDESRWHAMDADQQRALIDHELYHIVLKPDKKDPKKVALDCRGRPKIGMRKHDYDFGWFKQIAERHKDASSEVRQAKILFTTGRQTLFSFVPQAQALNP